MRLPVSVSALVTGVLVTGAALALPFGSRVLADEAATAGAVKAAPGSTASTVQLDGDALQPGETIEKGDAGYTVQEMPDGTLRDSHGGTWTPERIKTAHEKHDDSFIVGQDKPGIEGTPLVTPERVAAHDRFQLPPIDGATDDKEFATWRTQLVAAIKTHDWIKVQPYFSPDVHWSYGEDPGLKGFQSRWKPEEAKSVLWTELTKVFENGGTFGKSERGDTYFEAPYWSAWWPASYDPVEWSLLRGTKVALLDGPKDGAKTVATLDWAIVKREQAAALPPRGWTHVRTGDGKMGFVKDEALETPFGYRAICDKRSGKWLVSAFLTGE